jgi:hypothetical protein
LKGCRLPYLFGPLCRFCLEGTGGKCVNSGLSLLCFDAVFSVVDFEKMFAITRCVIATDVAVALFTLEADPFRIALLIAYVLA